jgi:hypothetical protein
MKLLILFILVLNCSVCAFNNAIKDTNSFENIIESSYCNSRVVVIGHVCEEIGGSSSVRII